ncbi:hypothetical protein CP061683_0498B, partial [Chlamydia psittaci 06-1683]
IHYVKMVELRAEFEIIEMFSIMYFTL